jgi:hypothetical protein
MLRSCLGQILGVSIGINRSNGFKQVDYGTASRRHDFSGRGFWPATLNCYPGLILRNAVRLKWIGPWSWIVFTRKCHSSTQQARSPAEQIVTHISASKTVLWRWRLGFARRRCSSDGGGEASPDGGSVEFCSGGGSGDRVWARERRPTCDRERRPSSPLHPSFMPRYVSCVWPTILDVIRRIRWFVDVIGISDSGGAVLGRCDLY